MADKLLTTAQCEAITAALESALSSITLGEITLHLSADSIIHATSKNGTARGDLDTIGALVSGLAGAALEYDLSQAGFRGVEVPSRPEERNNAVEMLLTETEDGELSIADDAGRPDTARHRFVKKMTEIKLSPPIGEQAAALLAGQVIDAVNQSMHTALHGGAPPRR